MNAKSNRNLVTSLALGATCALLFSFQNCAPVDHGGDATETAASSSSQPIHLNSATPVGIQVDLMTVFGGQQTAVLQFNESATVAHDGCTYATACGGTGMTISLTAQTGGNGYHSRTYTFTKMPTTVTVQLSGQGHGYPPAFTVVNSDGSLGESLRAVACNGISDYGVSGYGQYPASFTCSLAQAQ